MSPPIELPMMAVCRRPGSVRSMPTTISARPRTASAIRAQSAARCWQEPCRILCKCRSHRYILAERRVLTGSSGALRQLDPRVTTDESDIDDHLTLEVRDGRRVSARLVLPAGARACYVLAHGAGAGMEHPFMSAAARELGALGIGTLRFQFPYMEQRSRRPDPPPACHATVRAAVAAAARLAPALPLFAGGRSFGGRMTSQAQALDP